MVCVWCPRKRILSSRVGYCSPFSLGQKDICHGVSAMLVEVGSGSVCVLESGPQRLTPTPRPDTESWVKAFVTQTGSFKVHK